MIASRGPTPGRDPLPPGSVWVRHVGPGAASLLAPAHWHVTFAGVHEWTVSDPDGSATARVRLRDVAPQVELADWLWQHYPATEPGLHQVRMRRIDALPAHAACALFDYGGELARGRAGALAVRDGRIATVFIAAAASERFAAALPGLIRILRSRRVAGPGPPAAAQRALLARLQPLALYGLDD